jgi:hypothetical protein
MLKKTVLVHALALDGAVECAGAVFGKVAPGVATPSS